MKSPFSVSVIMPAFNEAENLPFAIEECIELLSTLTDQYEVIVVDDCSTDTTQEVLVSLKKTYPCLQVIYNKHTLGCHPSSLIGLKVASSEVLIFLPADRQLSLSSISKFLKVIDNYDLVCSYRRKRADTFCRRLVSRFYNTMLRFCFGINLHDTHSAIAVKKKVVQAIANKVQSSCAFAGCEFILRALKQGFKVAEIEVDHLPRVAGVAKGANIKDGIWSLLNILQFCLELKEFPFFSLNKKISVEKSRNPIKT